MECDEFVNITSKNFFLKQRYSGLLEIIIEFLSFDEKLILLSLNQKFKNCIVKKTKFIKVVIKFLYVFKNIFYFNFNLLDLLLVLEIFQKRINRNFK